MSDTTTNIDAREVTIGGDTHTLPLVEIETTERYAPTFDRDKFINGGYGYCNAIQDCRSLLFSDMGFGRLMTIQGYILGLKHAGNVHLANQYADWFLTTLERLASTELLTVTVDGIKRQNVPSSKVALGDDGSLHSFTFQRYTLLHPAKYLQTLWELQYVDEWKECSFTAQRCEVHKRLRTLTQCRYGDYDSGFINPHNATEWHQQCGDLHYRPHYNGGLIFHGINQLSVRIGNDNNPWSTHT